MYIKNRQVDRTRRALQDALVSLIRERTYHDIDIKEITDRANTARVTFYRHYTTKDEVLLDFLARLYEDLKETMGGFCYEQIIDVANPPSLALFLLIEQDKALYRRLLHSPMGMTIQNRVRLYIVEQITSVLGTALDYAERPIDLIANHMASCTIGNICWWLMNEDMASTYTASQMAQITQALAIGGVSVLIPSSEETLRDMAHQRLRDVTAQDVISQALD